MATYVRHHWVDGTCLSCGLEESTFEERSAEGPMPSCPGDLDTVVIGYVKCALWSSTDEDGLSLAEERHKTEDDIDPESLDTMRGEVRDFLELLDREGVKWRDLESEQVGHDFWLTRNGHGAGFWDRGLGERGDLLTKWAKTYGESHLWLGDNGMIDVT